VTLRNDRNVGKI